MKSSIYTKEYMEELEKIMEEVQFRNLIDPISDRIKRGLAAARAKGVRLGRPPKTKRKTLRA
ncbi:MAG TPA: hypothetical protein VJB59_09845 [Bdellovibrionota bacterium]|nr:hypothetical protein [Bdellovibrionota bacterium]